MTTPEFGKPRAIMIYKDDGVERVDTKYTYRLFCGCNMERTFTDPGEAIRALNEAAASESEGEDSYCLVAYADGRALGTYLAPFPIDGLL